MANDMSSRPDPEHALRLVCDEADASLPEDLDASNLAPEAIESALEALASQPGVAGCRLTRMLSAGWVATSKRDAFVAAAQETQDPRGWLGTPDQTAATLLVLLDLGVGRTAPLVLRAADALLGESPLGLPGLHAVRLTGRSADTRVEYGLQTLPLDREGDLDDQLLRVASLLEEPFRNRVEEARAHLRHLSQRVLRGERPTARAARSLRGIGEREAALITDLSLPSWLRSRDVDGLILGDPDVTCDVALALRIHELDQPA